MYIIFNLIFADTFKETGNLFNNQMNINIS